MFDKNRVSPIKYDGEEYDIPFVYVASCKDLVVSRPRVNLHLYY